MKPFIRIFFPILLILFFAIQGCSRTPDKELIRRSMDSAVKAAEARDVPAFMESVSKDYRDDNGNDYKAIKQMVFYEFMKGERVNVFLRSADIEVAGDKAAVVANVILARGKEVKSLKDIVPEDADGFRFNIMFKKEKGGWKALNAKWESIGIAGLL